MTPRALLALPVLAALGAGLLVPATAAEAAAPATPTSGPGQVSSLRVNFGITLSPGTEALRVTITSPGLPTEGGTARVRGVTSVTIGSKGNQLLGRTYTHTVVAIGADGAESAPLILRGVPTRQPLMRPQALSSTSSFRVAVAAPGNDPATRYTTKYAEVRPGTDPLASVLTPWAQGVTASSLLFGAPAGPGVVATTARQGSTYVVVGTSTDRFGNRNVERAITSYARAVPIDSTRASLSGGARTETRTGSYGGTVARLPRAGAAAVVRVAGERLRLIGERCPTCGAVDVFAGSTRLARVDTYARARQVRQVLWSRTFITDRSVPLTLRAVGTPRRPDVLVDAVEGLRWSGPGRAGLSRGQNLCVCSAEELSTPLSGGALYLAGMSSPDGRFEVRRRGSGGVDEVIFTTPEELPPGVVLRLRPDGNVVLVDREQAVLWSTGTAGVGSAYLMLQGDGNLVLYRASDGRAFWSSRSGRLG